MHRNLTVLVIAVSTCGAVACTKRSQLPREAKRISSVSFAASAALPCAPCDMTVIADDTVQFKIRETTGFSLVSDDSTWLVYSAFGGAGGYRGAGQALWRYDVKSATSRLLMREYYLIEQLAFLRVPGGEPMILVSMQEPLSLERHIAIADPARGEVFRAERSVVQQSDPESITIVEWGTTASWSSDALSDSSGLPSAAPARVWTLPLAQLRQFAVIRNEERVWGTMVEAPPPDLFRIDPTPSPAGPAFRPQAPTGTRTSLPKSPFGRPLPGQTLPGMSGQTQPGPPRRP